MRLLRLSMDRLLLEDEEVYEQYAGSASCQECHASEFDKWKPSNHRLAERPLMTQFDEESFSQSMNLKLLLSNPRPVRIPQDISSKHLEWGVQIRCIAWIG
jgi:hypothetical protein